MAVPPFCFPHFRSNWPELIDAVLHPVWIIRNNSGRYRFAIVFIEAVNETGPAPFYNRVVRQISCLFCVPVWRYYEGFNCYSAVWIKGGIYVMNIFVSRVFYAKFTSGSAVWIILNHLMPVLDGLTILTSRKNQTFTENICIYTYTKRGCFHFRIIVNWCFSFSNNFIFSLAKSTEYLGDF